MKKLINEYITKINDLELTGAKLCVVLEKELRKILPDIQVNLGCTKTGNDKLCLFDKTHNHKRVEGLNLRIIITLVFPKLSDYINTPYELYVTKKEKTEIIKLLQEVKDERN